MSVEAKIKELLDRAGGSQQLTEESAETLNSTGSMGSTGAKAAASMKKDTSKAATAATAGDTTQPKQGSSQDASYSEMDETDVGAKAASSVSKDNTLPKSKGDAKSVKTPAMEEVAVQETTLDIKSQLKAIFGKELSEEFHNQAASIFEAAVIARVNNEMEKISATLEEQAESRLVEYKETLVNHIDEYLNYVVEQWLTDNEVAVEQGIRNEISESLLEGIRTVFLENNISVPESKIDLVEQIESEAAELAIEFDEIVAENAALSEALEELKRQQVFESCTKGLTATEVEKLKSLVEGVEFETEELYKEKLSVIKENYFPTNKKPESVQNLIEESGSAPALPSNDTISKYAEFITRSAKSR